MSSREATRKKRRRKRLIRTFIRSAIVTLVCILLLLGVGYWAYQTFIYNPGSSTSGNSSGIGNLFQPNEEEEEERVNQTVAVFGTDIDGYRTDVILVINFNSETNKVKVVSVPRDTKVDWTDEYNEQLMEIRNQTRQVSKINEMTAYAGINNIRDFTVKHLESLLGTPIDNYVVVSISAFRDIVDAIGGVEVDVPMNMYYVDPYQDLYIDLDKGLQLLDGEKAEMLVRYRSGYVDGDLGRIETQQLFLDAFADKVLSPQIITRIPQILSVVFSAVETDVQLSEILEYYQYVEAFDVNNIEYYMLPGESKYISGAWYFVADMDAMGDFTNQVFYEHLIPAPEEPEVEDSTMEEGQVEESEEAFAQVIEDKTVSIEILNATTVNGAAAKEKTFLEGYGYTVQSVGNYITARVDGTLILAKDTKMAEQFKTYYPEAVIEQRDTLATDIQIILGY